MSIGISDEHVELAASLRKWAAGLGGTEATRLAETDADAAFDDVWKAAAEMALSESCSAETRAGSRAGLASSSA